VTVSRPRRAACARVATAFAAAIAAGVLVGCSTISSMFSAEKPKPKELEPIVAPITVRPVWNQNIGAIQFPLSVAVNGNVLTLANDGADLVYTFDAQAENTGIAELLRELSKRGVDFKDLKTEQSSLEEIFVSLVSTRA